MLSNSLNKLRRISVQALLRGCLQAVLAVPAAAQYRFDVWTTENGLPDNTVNSVVQTRDGYLWFTTFDGLVRYDGARFTVFNASHIPGLKSNRFIRLLEDHAGNLWASTERSELVKYSAGIFTTYPFGRLDDRRRNHRQRQWLNHRLHHHQRCACDDDRAGGQQQRCSLYHERRAGW